MAYLDEDVLYQNIEEKYKVAKGEARKAYSDVLDTICEMPRADVVPSSECERLRHILDCYAFEYGSVRDHHLVEVVRCKDCKFSECCVVSIHAYNEELGVEHIPDPNEFYCAYGVRKEIRK